MRKLIIICVSVAFALVACRGGNNSQADQEIIVLTVASEMVDCMGVAPQKCLLIMHDGSDGWEFWYSGIQGFDYESGYEYELEIEVKHVDNPPADGSSIVYELVKVISKQEKTSSNMPIR